MGLIWIRAQIHDGFFHLFSMGLDKALLLFLLLGYFIAYILLHMY